MSEGEQDPSGRSGGSIAKNPEDCCPGQGLNSLFQCIPINCSTDWDGIAALRIRKASLSFPSPPLTLSLYDSMISSAELILL